MIYIVHIKPDECLVHPGTVERARELVQARLSRTDLPAAPGWEVLQLRRAMKQGPSNGSPYVVPETETARALHDVAVGAVGTSSVALANLLHVERRPGEAAFVTEAWKKEYALWVFRCFAGAGPKDWDADQLNRWHPENHLSFLAGLKQRAQGRAIRYVPEKEVKVVRQLEGLLADKPLESSETTLMPYVRWLNLASPAQEAFLLGHEKSPEPA